MDINNVLKQEADVILNVLLPAISRYGTVHFLGSYNLDTMAWKDLDISILSEDLLSETVFNIVREVGTLLSPTELLLKDYSYVVSKHGNKGRYIQCKQVHIGGIIWDKVDIIVSDNPEHIQDQLDRNMYWKSLIKESEREVITRLKKVLSVHPLYRKDILSVDIYRAVCVDNVEDLEQFAEWLLNTKNVVM